jgi:hypothetical protein
VSLKKDEGNVYGAATSPDSDNMLSSPTEKYGAIAIIAVLIVLLYHHQEGGYVWPTVKLYIDNAKVLDRGCQVNPTFWNVGQYLTHDYNLWMVMSHPQKQLLLHVDFEWVRGHQSIAEYNKNAVAVLLNTDVDKLATLQYNKEQAISQWSAFISEALCYHQLRFHVQNIYNVVASRESDKLLLEYYKSHGWNDDALAMVDWPNMEKILKRCHPIKRCNTIQSMHDWQNIRHQKLQLHSSSTMEGQNTTSKSYMLKNEDIGNAHFTVGTIGIIKYLRLYTPLCCIDTFDGFNDWI